jgi:cytochrome c-type biogenesis protein
MMEADVVSLPLALAAGILSFLSPCVLPLVPAYLGYIGGSSATSGSRPEQSRLILSALLFVLGLATVFTLLGATASLVGQVLLEYRPIVAKVAGALIIFFGLYLSGLLSPSFLMGERRVDFVAVRGKGHLGAFLMGAAFGAGWTPCIGAILGSILLLASQSQTVTQGMSLLFVYALGLGLPFIALALAFDSSRGVMTWLKRRMLWVRIVSGAVLVLMGVLVFTERMTMIAAWFVGIFGTGLAI